MLATELDTAANQCCISLSKMDEAEAKQGSDRSTATRVVLRSCRRKLRLTLRFYQPINYQPRNYSTKIDRIAICHSSEDGCSATKMSQTSKGSAISNRTIGRCMHERWLQFLPVGTQIKIKNYNNPLKNDNPRKAEKSLLQLKLL